ncbi:MAG: energy-converting hydrogenase B subunit D [Sulfurimonas sp.]|jgi:energy-converting hydrogenase B subunit D|uniref:Na(+)/H(+) antiporter subunit B n=1 Tax=Sulfurimonas sp. TaxID=2022749 RepID=UPI0039E52A8B
MIGLLITSIFIGMIIVTFAAIIQKKLADSIILFMGVGLGSVLLYTIFRAPDVALTEVVIGSGVGTLIFLMALKHLRASE